MITWKGPYAIYGSHTKSNQHEINFTFHECKLCLLPFFFLDCLHRGTPQYFLKYQVTPNSGTFLFSNSELVKFRCTLGLSKCDVLQMADLLRQNHHQNK